MSIGPNPAGFIDLPDSKLAAYQIVTDTLLVKIAENANFAHVRCEIIFMGYYKDGDTLPLPISQIDGYQYSQREILFDWTLYSTHPTDSSFVSGQAVAPDIGSGLTNVQVADVYYYVADIDDATGKVSISVSYFARSAVSETVTKDGVLKVFAICQRASVNVPS